MYKITCCPIGCFECYILLFLFTNQCDPFCTKSCQLDVVNASILFLCTNQCYPLCKKTSV